MTIDLFKRISNYVSKNIEKRSSILDIYRGSAVFLMIIYHFCWDLRAFGYVKYALSDPFWVNFRGIIMTLFISAVGWSAYLAYRHGINGTNLFKRQGKLLLCAGVISLGSYIAFPNNWIFFGIIHFIFIASLIIIPVARLPILSFLIGIGILTVYLVNDDVRNFSLHHALTSTFTLPSYTLDLVNIVPWIAIVFLGPILGYFKLHNLHVPNHPIFTIFAFLGRHALLIYLCHQLLIYNLISFTTFILNTLK